MNEILEEGVSRMMRTAFAQALKSSHETGRVEIHISSDVYDVLHAQCEHAVANWDDRPIDTAWGFPVVVEPGAPPAHVAVHSVYTIY